MPTEYSSKQKISYLTFTAVITSCLLCSSSFIFIFLLPSRSSSDSTVASVSNHAGPVRSLDVNPFQPNLLASGANESEIFIWDLNNLTKPMSPGNKSHPLEDVTGLAWNRQVGG